MAKSKIQSCWSQPAFQFIHQHSETLFFIRVFPNQKESNWRWNPMKLEQYNKFGFDMLEILQSWTHARGCKRGSSLAKVCASVFRASSRVRRLAQLATISTGRLIKIQHNLPIERRLHIGLKFQIHFTQRFKANSLPLTEIKYRTYPRSPVPQTGRNFLHLDLVEWLGLVQSDLHYSASSILIGGQYDGGSKCGFFRLIWFNAFGRILSQKPDSRTKKATGIFLISSNFRHLYFRSIPTTTNDCSTDTRFWVLDSSLILSPCLGIQSLRTLSNLTWPTNLLAWNLTANDHSSISQLSPIGKPDVWRNNQFFHPLFLSFRSIFFPKPNSHMLGMLQNSYAPYRKYTGAVWKKSILTSPDNSSDSYFFHQVSKGLAQVHRKFHYRMITTMAVARS